MDISQCLLAVVVVDQVDYEQEHHHREGAETTPE
jgi:hypothetical protein